MKKNSNDLYPHINLDNFPDLHKIFSYFSQLEFKFESFLKTKLLNHDDSQAVYSIDSRPWRFCIRHIINLSTLARVYTSDTTRPLMLYVLLTVLGNSCFVSHV